MEANYGAYVRQNSVLIFQIIEGPATISASVVHLYWLKNGLLPAPAHFWQCCSPSLVRQKLNLNDEWHRNRDICPTMGFRNKVGGICFARVVVL